MIAPEVGHTERVADHPEDVGVLQEQRAPAEAVERVSEGVDLVAVAVGDRADRAERDVAGRERRGHGGAREQLLRRVAADRAGRRGQHRAPGAARGPASRRRVPARGRTR